MKNSLSDKLGLDNGQNKALGSQAIVKCSWQTEMLYFTSLSCEIQDGLCR